MTEIEYREKPCPGCGGRVEVRSNRSSFCKECYHDRYNRRPCPRCSGKMRKKSIICQACNDAEAGNMREMTEAETAWLAGILEGEGTFGRSRPRVAVNMTDRDIIERLHQVTGIGNMMYDRPGQQAHHKPYSVWYVQRTEHAAQLVRAVLPWLGIRRRSEALRMLRNSGVEAP